MTHTVHPRRAIYKAMYYCNVQWQLNVNKVVSCVDSSSDTHSHILY